MIQFTCAVLFVLAIVIFGGLAAAANLLGHDACNPNPKDPDNDPTD